MSRKTGKKDQGGRKSGMSQSRHDWTRWIAVASLVVSLLALGLTRFDAWDATRAKRERAEFMSYRIGVDLGVYHATDQLAQIPSLAATKGVAQEMLRNAPSLAAELELNVDIPDALESSSSDALQMRVLARIRDLHGRRAVEAYALGADLGQAMALVSPFAVSQPESPLPSELDSTLDDLVSNVNRQLEVLGRPQRVELDRESAARSWERLSALDHDLVEAWDPSTSKWRQLK